MAMTCTLGPNGRLFVLMNGVLFYLVVGALIFSSLEEEIEHEHVMQLRQLRQEFADKVKGAVTAGELEDFITEIVYYSESGILATNNVTFSSSWSFGQAFFFVGTLVTTIGYGHTIPLSDSGKLFSIFYAMIGVPLTLGMCSAIASRIMLPLTALLVYLKNKLIHINKELYIKLIHLSIVLFLLLTLFFLIPAAIFNALEDDWNYLDSVYYCFISLTTIGLGDYIPGEGYSQPARAFYKVSVTIYLFLGIVCIMATISVVSSIKQLSFTTYFELPDNSISDEETANLTNSETAPARYTEESAPSVVTVVEAKPGDKS